MGRLQVIVACALLGLMVSVSFMPGHPLGSGGPMKSFPGVSRSIHSKKTWWLPDIRFLGLLAL